MKTEVKELQDNRVQLEVEVDAEEFRKEMNAAFKRLVRDISIPGFRKGRVPRPVFEARFGKEVIEQEAAQRITPRAYSDALFSEDIAPIDEPDIEILEVGEGKPFRFKVEVPVPPTPELGQYKGLEAEKTVLVVGDEDVDEYIESLRKQHAELVPVENRDVVEEGDYVLIDLEGFVDGRPFPGGAAQGQQIRVGSGRYFFGHDDELVGAKKDEPFELTVTAPPDLDDEELAGKEITFKVVVRQISETKLPEVDEEFVKDVSDFDTLEEFREDIRKQLQESFNQRVEEQLRHELRHKVAENAQVDIPETMIENRVAVLRNDLSERLRRLGMDIEQYCERMQISEDELEQRMRDEAAHSIKEELVLEAIAKAEGLEPTDEELEKATQEIIDSLRDKKSGERYFRSPEQQSVLRRHLRRSKALDFVVEQANITVIEKTSAELRAEAEAAQEDSAGREKEGATAEERSETKSTQSNIVIARNMQEARQVAEEMQRQTAKEES